LYLRQRYLTENHIVRKSHYRAIVRNLFVTKPIVIFVTSYSIWYVKCIETRMNR